MSLMCPAGAGGQPVVVVPTEAGKSRRFTLNEFAEARLDAYYWDGDYSDYWLEVYPDFVFDAAIEAVVAAGRAGMA